MMQSHITLELERLSVRSSRPTPAASHFVRKKLHSSSRLEIIPEPGTSIMTQRFHVSV